LTGSSLPRRIAVAAAGIPIALAAVWFGGWVLVSGVAVLALVGVHELFRLAQARGVRPLRPLGYAAAVAAPVVAYGLCRTPPLSPAAAWYAAVAWFLAVLADAVARRPPDQGPLGAVTVTVFAPLYAGVLPSFLIALRHAGGHDRPTATALVFLPLLVVWSCDSLAMAGGALIGGAKFAPAISPKKTWAGTISGSVAATIIAPLYGIVVLQPAGLDLGPVRLAVLGLVLSVLGQVGDLVESLFKREAGVKDSGGLFPGHGGVLDRLDSLYWALPAGMALLSRWGAS
jgi:phosphatidate cytidylyltransferase